MSAPASAAAFGVGELAAVGEAVGRGVDDAHDLRLVEADGALAELQRRARRGQRGPLRGHVIVEAVFDALDRHQLGRGSAMAIDRDQLDGGEPVQPAGEPRDLAVMAEGRIDEAGRAEERAHRSAL